MELIPKQSSILQFAGYTKENRARLAIVLLMLGTVSFLSTRVFYVV